MNNLLRTISGSTSKATLPEADLKLLLSSVRDFRDIKAADSFYGSLEGVLLELRTVTTDNRDAEAFLKPVSRTEYPDYYEIIKHPMDLGTMLKNVKNRKYKSKQEFAADLNLIWKNCFKYNSGPEHVLRGCVTRLKRKADHLLAHLSDRPDRITINGLPTPSAPNSSSSSRETPFKPVKINGIVNGITPHEHTPTPDPSTPQGNMTPTPGPSTYSQSKSPHSGHESTVKSSPPTGIPFEDQPALIRTPEKMGLFLDLDRELQSALDGVSEEVDVFPMLGLDTKGKRKETLLLRLKNLADDSMDVEAEDISAAGDDGVAKAHLKRKRSSGAQDQRKRPRLADSLVTLDPTCPATEREEKLLETWWEAARSSLLLVGGLPSLLQPSDMDGRREKAGKGTGITVLGTTLRGQRKGSKRKRSSLLSRPHKRTKSLLKLMNDNIATLARVRRTHSKFVALNAASDPNNPAIPSSEVASDLDIGVQVADDNGWDLPEEVGQEAANNCLGWMTTKVLQHAGFQGSSQAALSVLTSVAEEYLQNVGRTIRFMCDKYSNTMTPEEIILHTLFESGTTEIQDLERYIKDDVVRYGGRLGDLEKKLVGAYREVTSVEVPSEEGMFEDGDQVDHWASGGLADILGEGEDFLGLRELGIEAEFGLKSLSVPKRLWKGKSGAEDRSAPDRTSAGEPPPPFPPPPPFVPLEFSKVDSQIGLLKHFYQEQFATLAASSSTSTLPDITAVGSINPSVFMSATPVSSHTSSSSMLPLQPSPTAPLPDDLPNPARAKIGPLGQVIITNPSIATKQKRGKAKEVPAEKGKSRDPEGVSPKKKELKKTSKDDVKGGTTDADNQVTGIDVNGTGPKKKVKGGGGKKSIKNAKPTLEVPPAIVASA